MLSSIIIADTSVLISLENIGYLYLLEQLYKKIKITPEIEEEFGSTIPDWVEVIPVVDKEKLNILFFSLDIGEASAIALALETPNSLLIIDERKGRKIAQEMGLKITGVIGILIKAKSEGLISQITPLLDALIEVGVRISPSLYKKVLTICQE